MTMVLLGAGPLRQRPVSLLKSCCPLPDVADFDGTAPTPVAPLIVCDTTTEAAARRLASLLSLNILRLDEVTAGALEPILDLVVLVNLRDIAAVRSLRSGLGEIRPRPGNRAFLVSSGPQQHADEVQALALGATLLLRRETCFRQLRRMLSVSDRAPVQPRQATALAKAPGGEAILKTGKTLAGLFGSFTADAPIAVGEIEQFGAEVVGSVAEVGADAWLASVRDYHEGTFQHCLLVTATAASFANRHRSGREATLKLTAAALFHDIGKAEVPLHILDKPGKLSEDEFAAIKMHPARGHEYLLRQGGVDPQVLDAVLHHHEALDGSGYPDGLRGEQIAPMVRILTVCDIFAALVEARPYKPANPPQDAIAILVKMALEHKVDYQVVRSLAEVFDMSPPRTLGEVSANLMELERSS